MDNSNAVAASSYAPRSPQPPVAPAWARRMCLLALLGATVWFARVGRGHIQNEDPDFEYFYKAGAWLLAHGSLDPGHDLVDGRYEERGTLDWYWPFVSRFMTLFALVPYRWAGYIWLALNLAAMWTTIRLLGRHLSGLPPRDWPVTQLLPFLFLAAYWHWEFRLNQINNFTLLLLVANFVCWQQGRRVLAGFWLGLAVLLKITPGLLVLWFLLKRQYRTAGVAVLTVVLAGPLADIIAFGPSQTVDSYRVWAENAVTTGSHAGLIRAQREMDWRNQGLGAVLSRWLHPTNYNTHFDNDPRVAAKYSESEVKTINVAALSLPAVAHLATAITVVTLVGLLWLARRPAGKLSPWQLRFEWVLFMLAMLWLMPVLRRYHMIWALPAMSLLAGGIHYAGWSSRWSKLALSCIGLVVLSQLVLLHKPLEAGGTILAAVAVLACPVLLMVWRLSRHPDVLPGPAGELGAEVNHQPAVHHA
ncbi:MAG: DUF2029 domain-containing protein [Phycisphaerae bacterium]|nr:DUF2029 domain-containing protein [Phycisphaerae bacterium]